MPGLITFDTATPGAATVLGPVNGIGSEWVVGMDYRPSNGVLYLVTADTTGMGRLYTLNTSTRVATRVNAGNAFALNLPTAFGLDVDVDPVSDDLRLVSNNGQNIRVSLDAGALIANDAALSYAPTDPAAGMPATVVAIGYTNDVAGATSTILYGIDSIRDQLVILGDATTGPSGGVLFSQGGLGFGTTRASLDITAANVAYASLTPNATNKSTLVTIDLARGVATTVGTIGANDNLIGAVSAMAVVPGPSGPTGPTPDNQNQVINQLVIANLQAIFAQPLPRQIALAMIAQLGDANGDGFADVTALVGLRVRVRGRLAVQVFSLTFDGLSPGGGLIGPPRLLGTF